MIIKQFRSKAKRCDTVTAFDDGCCMKQFCFREGNNFFFRNQSLIQGGGSPKQNFTLKACFWPKKPTLRRKATF